MVSFSMLIMWYVITFSGNTRLDRAWFFILFAFNLPFIYWKPFLSAISLWNNGSMSCCFYACSELVSLLFLSCQESKKLEQLYCDPSQRLVAGCVLMDVDTAVVSDRKGSIAVLSRSDRFECMFYINSSAITSSWLFYYQYFLFSYWMYQYKASLCPRYWKSRMQLDIELCLLYG